MSDNASPVKVVSNADQETIKDDIVDDAPLSSAGHPDAKLDENPVSHLNGHDSSQTNGHPSTPTLNGEARHGHDDHDALDNDERPSKRRRTRDTTPPNSIRKPKLESPPWKKAEAEGPTSYTENGRRKSGRINTVPLEQLPPTKTRLTRRALHDTQATAATRRPNTPSNQASKTPQSNGKRSSARQTGHARQLSDTTPKSTDRRNGTVSKNSARATRRRTPSAPSQPSRQSIRQRRSSRITDAVEQQQSSGRSPRIKLRVGRSGVIPLVHPGQVPKRPKIGSDFDDFWQRAGEIAIEDGGILSAEDGPLYTFADAQKDAQSIMQIEKEVEDGGLLSTQRCSLFVPERPEEPPRQYARQDHMNRAVLNFRKLMVGEQIRHRATAKRVAEACRDEWIRRQPKSAEQIEAEERAKWLFRYRMVVRSLLGTWENVRLEVNRRRLEAWEAEEQRRVKAALNEAVNLSEQKLQARQSGLDSELISEDEDGFDDVTDDQSMMHSEADDNSPLSEAGGSNTDNLSSADDDSDNMSSSADEEEGDDAKDPVDEELTQDQLREKYGQISLRDAQKRQLDSVQADSGSDKHPKDTENDSSDESVDMDDDMGSSDDADDDSESEDSDAEGSESETDAGGLLGLLFGKSELKALETDAEAKSERAGEDIQMHDDNGHVSKVEAGVEDVVEDDDNDVSLVQYPQSVGDKNAPTDAASDAEIKETKPKETADSPLPRGQTEGLDADEPLAEPKVDMTNGSNALDASQAADDAGTPTAIAPTANLGSQDVMMTNGTSSSTEISRATSTQPTKEHKIPIPFLLRGTLREYQHHGLDWLAGLYANNTNGILADEMGLGKTIQTIALLAHLASYHEVWGPHLVVVPTSVMLNWEMEFKKWCPGFKILAYYGTQEERKRKRQGWNNDDVWNVCITSYQLVLQDQQVFKRRRWHYLILDEAHNIKNFKSQRWQTLLGFNTQARLLLTGTPLQNNLTELWSLLFFLMPAENGVGGFADLQEFHDWFHKPESQILESGREQMDEEAKAIISKLHKVLRPYLLRRLKADVEKQMPAKYEHVEFCRLSKRQRELYDGFLARADTKSTLEGGNYLSIINCLMQLRKVCNHPDLFVDRPIMTSFRMAKSIAADYDFTERRVQTLLATPLMSTVDLGFLNLIPTSHEHLSLSAADRVAQLSSHRPLNELREAQRHRAESTHSHLDPSTVQSNIEYLESASRWGRFEELQHCVYLNALRRQQRPIYGKNVVQLLTIGAAERPYKPRPSVPKQVMAWFEDDSTLIRAACPTLSQRADSLRLTIEKFSCVTPAVVTRDLEQFVLGRQGVQAFTEADLKLSAPVRWAPFMPKEPPWDPWHEARMRLSIQFPDKRLLQYDCGKLQALDKLLRRLQSGGHRALIFTQMTKVLDILEQFLNIHGHKYLRLDGATKVEQRQILTDRFNHDPRILCFILSTRSGGLGINLTGADTVIFYDQDWNPAMDKQCQDRCHRIGQTRDVHIYRLISEHTIEANILRKASQKQMLDDVVIQEGEFTTDHFDKVSVRDVLSEKLDSTSQGVSAADAALDRVLGGPDNSSSAQRTVGRVLEQAEDREDVTAARAAEKEILADDADFTERPSNTASGASTTRQGTPAGKSVLDGGILDVTDIEAEMAEVEVNAFGDRMGTIDDFMLKFLGELLKHTKLELPKDKKKSKRKKGRDTRKR
ncbi:type III restriction enzyme, res subunit domain-containing protein [Sarocladium implicatum]|nr:type III restriction enzyme, res subunit domain-containing protein [Sarocladium implicatum]